MGLAEYNRKRDFHKTAEPPGRLGASPRGNSFVIQKHAASRLHYDFRLELDGVLKSWSVPKGPSFDPAVKRLAVAVEDHPIDYGDFEGVIPAGEYGGGTVLLWDRGTWEPLSDPAKALASGQLKFELSGEKLQGRWVLVKIRDRGGAGGRRMGPEDRSWLLIKERDNHARPESEWKVVEARPQSVATGRDLPAIASASDRVWHSNRDRPDPSALAGARTAGLPEFLAPAVATRGRRVPDADDWFHEVEVRGERLMCRIDGGNAVLLDADGRERTDAFAGFSRAARALPLHDALIDGIATALGPTGDTSDAKPADTFYVFDLIHLDGHDLRKVPLSERKSLLQEIVNAAGVLPALRFVDHVAGRGAETFAAAQSLGAPGLVSKRASSHYRPGPPANKDWRVVACAVGAHNGSHGPASAKKTVRARKKKRATGKSKAPKTAKGQKLSPERKTPRRSKRK